MMTEGGGELLEQLEVQLGGGTPLGAAVHHGGRRPFGQLRDRRGQGCRHACAVGAALEDAGATVHGREEFSVARHRLRGPQKQIALRPEREVKRVEQPLLGGSLHIDQQVAAADQIEMREGGILEHVVRREQDDLPELPAHAIPARFADEEAAQALVADVRHIHL